MTTQLAKAKFRDEVFNSSLCDESGSHQTQTLACDTVLSTSYDGGMFNGRNPCYCVSDNNSHDSDEPLIHNALHEGSLCHCIEAKKLEVAQLVKQKTW